MDIAVDEALAGRRLDPLHDELMADLKERMTEAAKGFDPDEVLKTWMGASNDGMNQMMDFWRQMTDASGKSKP